MAACQKTGAAARAFRRHGENIAAFQYSKTAAESCSIHLAAPDRNTFPKIEQERHCRVIPGFGLDKAGYRAGQQMGINEGNFQEVDVVNHQD